MSKDSEFKLSKFKIILLVFLAIIVLGGAILIPAQFRIYRQSMRGAATLQEARWATKVVVEKAKAKLEAEELNRQSEVIRAKGVSEANAIVADGLGGPEGYLRYLWIQGLHDGNSEVIYIPTEAGMPILEAGKR